MAALIPLLEGNETERGRFTGLMSHSQRVEELGFEPRFQELRGSLFLFPQSPVAFVFYVKFVSHSLA